MQAICGRPVKTLPRATLFVKSQPQQRQNRIIDFAFVNLHSATLPRATVKFLWSILGWIRWNYMPKSELA